MKISLAKNYYRGGGIEKILNDTMIPIAELKRMAARNGIALTMVEKDYALSWILCAIAETGYKNNLIFKGGTALRKIYFPNWRYSEDLDFTTSKPFTEPELRELIEAINVYLQQKIGLYVRLKSVHANPEYAQLKIKFLGPLQHEAGVKVDLSFNEVVVLKPENKTVLSEYSDKGKYFLVVYPLEEILAEKIRSILQRGKTRDYYDVWKLLKEHPTLINQDQARKVLAQKCKFKNVICTEELLFEKERIAEAQQHWEKGLAHQINALPDFRAVITECQEMLSALLQEK